MPSGWQQHRDTAEPSQAVTAAGLASPRAVIIPTPLPELLPAASPPLQSWHPPSWTVLASYPPALRSLRGSVGLSLLSEKNAAYPPSAEPSVHLSELPTARAPWLSCTGSVAPPLAALFSVELLRFVQKVLTGTDLLA